MTISQSVLVRPLPNRLDDFIARLGKSKTLFEQVGANVRLFRTVAGSESNAVLFVSTVDDWDAWAKAAAKLEGNADYAAFERLNANDPAGEVVANGILQEFELPS